MSGAKYGITPFDSGDVKIINNTLTSDVAAAIGRATGTTHIGAF